MGSYTCAAFIGNIYCVITVNSSASKLLSYEIRFHHFLAWLYGEDFSTLLEVLVNGGLEPSKPLGVHEEDGECENRP